MYMVIDLKSFYADCECQMRGLDMFKTNLVVCDISRGKGAITLAATPAIKAHGVNSRTRAYLLPKDIDIIYAKPRMKKYIEFSVKVYEAYLHFFSSEDIYVYSIDECFIDLNPYSKLYNNPIELANTIKEYVLKETGLVTTFGIGPNMFLAKVALDIISKHDKSNIGYLDLELFKEKIWPITDLTSVWSIGHRIKKRLNKLGIFSVRDIAFADKNLLHKEFGVIGLELYDHANGVDDTKLCEAKNVIVKNKSISEGQVLFRDYKKEEALVVLIEMVDVLTLRLIKEGYMAKNLSLFIGYKDSVLSFSKSIQLESYTNSYNTFLTCFKSMYRFCNNDYPIRQIRISFSTLVKQTNQLSLFESSLNEKEKNLFQTINVIKDKYGKNAIVKTVSLLPDGNQIKRNEFIGGHHE